MSSSDCCLPVLSKRHKTWSRTARWKSIPCKFKWPGPILSNHQVACKLNCCKNTAQMSQLPAKDKCCVDFWCFCLEKCLILHISPPSFSTKWPLLQPHAPVGMASRQLRQQQAPTEVQHHGILSEDTCEIFWKHKQNHEQLWTVPNRMPSRMLYANGTKTSERCNPLPFVQAHPTLPQHVTACYGMSQHVTEKKRAERSKKLRFIHFEWFSCERMWKAQMASMMWADIHAMPPNVSPATC